MNKQNILVLGATGFIGRNIALRLASRRGLNIVGTYFKTKPDTALSRKNITLIHADLTKKSDVEKIVQGKDVIIQAAATTSGAKDIVTKPYIHVTDNAIMNSLLFRAVHSSSVKHVIFLSCTVMYPNQNKPVAEEDFNYSITESYFGVGWTKVYIEKLCEFYSKIGATKYTAIRHTNLYGPYDKYDLERSHFFGATITKVLTSKANSIAVWGNGSEKRDLLYISDLVDFVEIVMKDQSVSFELVNVGSGEGHSIKEIVRKIIKISGRKLSLVFDTGKPTIPFNLTVNIGKARKKYKWKPKVSLEEGIRRTLQWYKKNYG